MSKPRTLRSLKDISEIKKPILEKKEIESKKEQNIIRVKLDEIKKPILEKKEIEPKEQNIIRVKLDEIKIETELKVEALKVPIQIESNIPKKISFAELIQKNKEDNILKNKRKLDFIDYSLVKPVSPIYEKLFIPQSPNKKCDTQHNNLTSAIITKHDSKKFEQITEQMILDDIFSDEINYNIEHYCQDNLFDCGHCGICFLNYCTYCCEYCDIYEYCKHCKCDSLICGCCPCDIVEKKKEDIPCNCCKFHDVLECNWHCICERSICGCCNKCDILLCGCCVNCGKFQDCGHCIIHFSRQIVGPKNKWKNRIKECKECFIDAI
jgi:hypothetical protein